MSPSPNSPAARASARLSPSMNWPARTSSSPMRS